MRRFLSFLVLGAWLAFTAAPALAQGPAEFSGMARFGPHRLLVVSDAKADSSEARLGILSLAGKTPRMLPVEVEDWGDGRASDLEACCPVPGTDDEFLLAESGWWKGHGGRLFRMKLTHHPDRGWTGQVLSVCRPLPMPAGGSTPSALQIEGIGAIRDPQGRLFVVLGLRGGPEGPGSLVWGHLDQEAFTLAGQRDFSTHSEISDSRSCADLQLLEEGGSFRVLTVAATDPDDRGPFRSAVLEVGRFTPRANGFDFQKTANRVLWRLEGLKVEALAPTPEVLEGSQFCVGTDDEFYGGIFRPLPALP